MKRIIKSIAVFFAALAFIFFSAVPFPVSSETVGENILQDGGFNEFSTKTGAMGKVTYTLKEWYLQNFKAAPNDGDPTSLYLSNSLDEGLLIKPYKDKNENYFTIDEAGNFAAVFDVAVTGSATVKITLTSEDGANKYVGSTDVSEIPVFETVSVSIAVDSAGSYRFQLEVTDIGASDKISLDNIGLYAATSETPDSGEPEIVELPVTDPGAYIRANGKKSGLRFVGRVNKDLYDDLVSKYTDVEAGMIIVPTDYLYDCEFTYQALSAAGKQMKICVAEYWNNEDTAAADGEYGFYCAIVNILPYNIDRKFSARSFLRYSVTNGSGETETRYIYGEYSEEDHARSAYDVACAAYDDTEEYETREDYVKNAILYFRNMIEHPTYSETPLGSNCFTLTFSAVKGYFVLDYGTGLYDVSVSGFKVDGADCDFSGGIYFASETSEIQVTVSVLAEEEFQDCPVTGKVYKTE